MYEVLYTGMVSPKCIGSVRSSQVSSAQLKRSDMAGLQTLALRDCHDLAGRNLQLAATRVSPDKHLHHRR